MISLKNIVTVITEMLSLSYYECASLFDRACGGGSEIIHSGETTITIKETTHNEITFRACTRS